MLVYVGTPFNHSATEVSPNSLKVSDLGLRGTVTLNGVTLLNTGLTVQQAIDNTGAQEPYFFLSVSKQANGQ